jgi:hypothetical protein
LLQKLKQMGREGYPKAKMVAGAKTAVRAEPRAASLPFLLSSTQNDNTGQTTRGEKSMRRLLSCTSAAVLLFGALTLRHPSAVAAQRERRSNQRPRAAGPRRAVGWDAVPSILARIRAPKFPARDFPINDFGARSGGEFDNTEAIRKAIEACNRAGGGRVVVPAGTFLTGAGHL